MGKYTNPSMKFEETLKEIKEILRIGKELDRVPGLIAAARRLSGELYPQEQKVAADTLSNIEGQLSGHITKARSKAAEGEFAKRQAERKTERFLQAKEKQATINSHRKAHAQNAAISRKQLVMSLPVGPIEAIHDLKPLAEAIHTHLGEAKSKAVADYIRERASRDDLPAVGFAAERVFAMPTNGSWECFRDFAYELATTYGAKWSKALMGFVNDEIAEETERVNYLKSVTG